MPRYLIIIPGREAQLLESWLGGRLQIIPARDPLDSPGTVSIAGLDAVTDEELAPVLARLRSGGPLYHASGPATGLPLTDDDSEPEADAAQDRATFMLPFVPVQDEYVTIRAAGHDPFLIDVADLKRGGRAEGCPDGGFCHHECTTGCWRVRYASPLGAAGWGDEWPEDIRAANAQSDGVL